MTCLVSFSDYQIQASELAKVLLVDHALLDLHHFPDGESLLRLPERLDKHVIIYRSLEHPNDKLIELMLFCKAARARGVETITLIAPYLCYMRQDKAFHQGEIISQLYIAEFLGELVDEIITVDPHLHRISSLAEIFPHTKTTTLSASELLGQFLQHNFAEIILLGPDSESQQWVSKIAQQGNYHFGVAEKVRHSDRDVSVTLPDIEVSGKHVVLVDDMISTGHTVAETAELLYQRGASRVDVLVTHALFSEGAMNLLHDAGVQHIWSSDSINHSSNCIPLTSLIAANISTQ